MIAAVGDTMPRQGSWMQTFTGRQFWPLDARVEDVDPADIAHSLSLTCRYGGHVDRFYSVAEHCVLMSYAVPAEDALWALLHDATEAYVGDMVRPLKQHMPDYRDVEDRLMAVIAGRFGLVTEWRELDTGEYTDRGFELDRVPVMPAAVRDADNRILLTERAALMSATRHRWAQEDLEPLAVHVTGWQPAVSERNYLDRLRELTC